MKQPRRRLLKELPLCVLFGALIVITTLERTTGFDSNSFFPNPRSSVRANPPGSASKAQEWLAKLMSQWFKLPLPPWSPPIAVKASRLVSSAPDDVRVTIEELRSSNAELRAEVLALRSHMQQRGFTLEGEESEGDPSARLTLSSPWPESSRPTDCPSPQTTSKRPPPKLPREARLAALALLWAAAVSVGGVFVPVAIGEGAARTLRWLDDGGTLVPERLRRPSGRDGGGRWSWRWLHQRRRWNPSLVRVRASGLMVQCDDQLRSSGGALAGAWSELAPRR